MKEIREALGTDHFCRRVFEKVFKGDIARLRGMEDMWKERQAPEALEYDTLEENSAQTKATVSQEDQRVWTLEECFVVFKDRYC